MDERKRRTEPSGAQFRKRRKAEEKRAKDKRYAGQVSMSDVHCV